MKELIVYPTPYLVKQHNKAQLEGKKGVTENFRSPMRVLLKNA